MQAHVLRPEAVGTDPLEAVMANLRPWLPSIMVFATFVVSGLLATAIGSWIGKRSKWR